MIEVRTKYTFQGGFSFDHIAEQAVGRPPDFSGSGFGQRDLGWVCKSEIEAERMKRALDKVGLRATLASDQTRMKMSDPRYEVLRVAMRKIAWPMAYLKEYAEDCGCKVDYPVAQQLVSDPNYLKQIAQQAMADIAAIDATGVNDRPPPAVSSKELGGGS